MIQTNKREQLLQDGYCRFENILPPDMIERLRDATEKMLDAQSQQQASATRAQGSLLPTTGDPIFAELVAWPAALDSFRALGWDHPCFSDGYVISKPGHGPRLFWHYDWFAWEDPASYGPLPQQVFAMYYLSDTTPENGCLRVVPGSHVRHNALHDRLREPHSAELGKAAHLDALEFSTRPDKIDVPVKAGDLLLGDARLLHAAHANATDGRRTLITLWYQPDLASLPERMQAQMAGKIQRPPDWWPPEARDLIRPLMARYDGNAAPYPRTLYRPKEAAGT